MTLQQAAGYQRLVEKFKLFEFQFAFYLAFEYIAPLYASWLVHQLLQRGTHQSKTHHPRALSLLMAYVGIFHGL